MYYTDKLYENVLQNHLESAGKMNVITGYTSPSFISRVMADFTGLSMNIYIGMAREGISAEYHECYKQIVMKTNEKVKIYYKYVPPLTHIKLYEIHYSAGFSTRFSGSANFTKGGFDEYQEILFEVPVEVCDVFNIVAQGSLLCTDPAVGNHIQFYMGEKQTESTAELIEENEADLPEETPHSDRSQRKEVSYRPRHFVGIIKERHKYYEIKIPLIFPDDPRASNSGINAWKKNIEPFLVSSNQYPLESFFPVSGKFTVYTDDGQKFAAEIDRNDSKKLRLDPSIYEYIKKRLNITENRSVTYNDLKKYGATEVLVKHMKNEENAFLFDFSPQFKWKEDYD